MKIVCINCGKANLENDAVQLSGAVRQQTYTVEMAGLKCPNCGYMTLSGQSMPEFGRLLADKYRAQHDLLTSDQIRNKRHQLGMSQDEFADHLGVGVASVKRWELGKIQDERSDAVIREKTKPIVTSINQYKFSHGGSTGTYTLCGTVGADVGSRVVSQSLLQNYGVVRIESLFEEPDIAVNQDNPVLLWTSIPTSRQYPEIVASGGRCGR